MSTSTGNEIDFPCPKPSGRCERCGGSSPTLFPANCSSRLSNWRRSPQPGATRKPIRMSLLTIGADRSHRSAVAALPKLVYRESTGRCATDYDG